VTCWKMHAALMWLKEENAALSEIASRLGYESAAAFSRAFKRFRRHLARRGPASRAARTAQRCGLAKAVERAFRSIATCAARRISRR